MMSRQFTRGAQLYNTTRCFTRSSIIRDINKDKMPVQKSNETAKDSDVLGPQMHRVSNFDKRMLVWVKRYPSIADVPKDVTADCILNSRSKARIKCCNYMIVATVVGCLISIFLGKREAARGGSLRKQRDEWFQEQLAQNKNK
ncbi:hypothetical protein PUN28_004904 [Cardiocondyla obscurior]|uniref:Uncharacterized protein n=1 Tax=Cardiocondyla obscurior TaxID=286306 RepID=A0AAW2GEU8_9HYME